MRSLSLCGRHFKWKREEGGKCLPGDYWFLHYEHPPGECWNYSLLRFTLRISLAPTAPLISLSFQVPATEASHHWISSLLPSCPGRISHQSNQWSNSWYLETDIVITSTQQHTLVLEVDYDLVFSRVMCIFFWIKVKCKLGGCYETLLLHCPILTILPKTIFHKGWLVSKCTGLNCIIKLII